MLPLSPAAQPAVVVVGASAGGVEALKALVSRLPSDFPAAICIVLHVPAHTPSRLPEVLRGVSTLKIAEAVDGEELEQGTIYTAVADRHLMIDGNRLRLTRGPKECRMRPAIDVLFRSAAVSKGNRVVGVVLTGMLDDGTAGLWAIKNRGGRALVQAPATAEYGSMPESAARHVAIDGALPADELAAEIDRQVRELPETDDNEPLTDSMRVEVTVAAEGNGLKSGVMELGKVSKYTCPDCHGVLVEIGDGDIVRFRCHTGHAFSVKTLLAEVNEAIDNALWTSLRAVEERALLLRQMAALAEKNGDRAGAAECIKQADNAEARSEALRALVLDPELFGHTPSADG